MPGPSSESPANRWKTFVDIATVVWLGLFAVSFVPGEQFSPPWLGTLALGLLGVFVADLGVTYVRSGLPPGAFLRRHWTDVLLVIPYFRIFRILRVGRGMRIVRLLRMRRATKAVRTSQRGLDHVKAVKKVRRIVPR